jgi:acetyl esterase/lipase
MAVGSWFLVCALLGALNTANAYRPVSRSGFWSLPAMVAGNMTSELPLHAVAFQVVGTLVFVAGGALDSTPGLVGIVVSVASWIGLVGLYRDAHRDREILGGVVGAATKQSITLRRVAVPSRGARKLYCSTRDIPYGDAGIRNQLDIWRRPDLPLDAAAPVLLQVHGGAWTRGRKDDQGGPLLTHLAERGWVCVAMNYRLSPAASWPDHMVDVKRAIAWVRANIATHGGDPSFVAVTGGSAGGHLVALAALSPGDPSFQPGFEDADTTVQAAVPMYGLYDLTNRSGGTRSDTVAFLEKHVFKSSVAADIERWEAASPLCRVGPDAPPFLIVHGRNDSFLPVEQARAFAASLRNVSRAPVAYAELPRAQHAFDFVSSVRVHHCVRGIEQFLTSARVPSSGGRT